MIEEVSQQSSLENAPELGAIDLVAKDEIQALMAKYMMLTDQGPDADAIVELFVEDGVWDSGETYGTYDGRGEIFAFFKSMEGSMAYTKHIATSAQLEVSGKVAKGSWQLIMLGETLEGETRWITGCYDNKFVKDVAGQWLFSHLKLRVEWQKTI